MFTLTTSCTATVDASDRSMLRELRGLVFRQLAECGQSPEIVETVQLLMCELVANVHKHCCDPMCSVRLVVAERIRLEVWDADPRFPVPRTAATFDEDGRGLFLLEEMATAWGVEPYPPGKIVWFECPSL